MKKITSHPGVWWLLVSVLLFLLDAQALTAQNFQQEIDSMLRRYEYTTDLTNQVAILNEVAYAYRRISPDSTLHYAQLALDKATELGDPGALAYAYKNKGIGLFKMGSDQDTIVAYYLKAIEFAEEAEDYYTQAACYNNIGLISLADLAYNEATQYFLSGVKIFDEHIAGDNFLKALMLGNIGTSYHRDGDNTRGIPYYEQALAMATRIGNKTIPSIFVDELARARMEEGNLEGAERDIISSMPLHDELGDMESKTESLLAWAEVKIMKSEFQAARDHAFAAYQVAKERAFLRNKKQALTRLAQAYQGLGKLDSAVYFAREAISVQEPGQMYSLNQDATSLLTKLYAQQEKFDTAYYYAQQELALERLNRDETKQRIADDLEAKYQNEQRQAEIERLSTERRRQQERIYGLVALVLLILFVLGGMIYQYRQKVLATRALNDTNEELRQTEETLKEKNKELERYIQSNLQLENFAHLASHDLREPMRNIVSFSQLLERSAVDKLNEREQEFLSFIVQGTERIDGLVKDLLAYSTVSNAPLDLEAVDLSKVIANVKDDLRQAIQESQAEIEVAALPVLPQADRSRLYQLFQNLLSNAIRYRRPGVAPQISICAEDQGDHYFFRLSDNGIGIDPHYYEHIFLLFKSLENKSVRNNSGIGLATAKRVVEDHRGKIWVEPNTPHGSAFCFTLAKVLRGGQVKELPRQVVENI